MATERLRAMAVSERSRSLIDQKLETLRRSGADPSVRKRSLHSAIRLVADPTARKPFLDELANIYSSQTETKLAARLSQVPKGRAELRDSGKRSRSGGSRMSAADELLFLGLYDEAAHELEAEGRLKDPAEAAAVYLRGGWSSRAIRYAEPAFKLTADHQIELIPQNVREMLYPIAFRDELLLHTAERSVDPRFLLAIMRQESRFDPTVKSVAAARGLMQFIPDTSERIARDLRITRFRQDDLFDPNIAIMFGSEYVSQIFRIYPNQPSAVAASYNGGEDNMQRWMGRAKVSEPERYVPEIMYAQTKDYVLKVISAYRVYLELYDEQLRPK
ncbi:lytic transglycosylase domain-containing protein [Leptolyngbya sp. 7M]|uniref:lytic transglycosylase domain-containing protein n=1 Tax=Leptolyngbya sp. 7M TaxID=2812896 RepID=UPI001B8AF172|nr:lytic transglycosylase domain-containing protein [Leptolyngbya sp. 7M]QYO67143.1 lytic transglycosylase domain-containing protein [Leptolyngbya sp. 7M]